MIDVWHKLVSSQKVVGISNLLSEEVILHTPLAYQPIQGKPYVMRYLTASFYTFINESFRYVREVQKENIAFLEFEVVVEGTFVNGIQIIEWNHENQITDFKIMFRSLKGLQMIQEKMALLLGNSINFSVHRN